jgi:ABC-type phosphate transport system permease subunit|tara:strand:+ start:3126 stop:3287 length:162 start_codon:yes stop_codon:yes gene_type:complete
MDYIKKLMKERTSWDGGVIIAVCGSVILLGGLAKVAAWVGLAYGIYTLLKSES